MNEMITNRVLSINCIILISWNDNIIWFNAKQICISLEYKQAKKAIKNNVEDIDKIQLKNMNNT